MLGYRILNWVGIIEQLSRNKANKSLHDLVPWPQFTMLNHFSHRPSEGKKVTDVARAMQLLQPGVTKTLHAMVKAGLLEVQGDPGDNRIKYHFITEKGLQTHKEAIARLTPGIRAAFEDWDAAEMEALFEKLDKLKIHLDDNR